MFAGAVAAAGPVIIHLLNRRRYRVLDWAAMDFLREALKRSRKMLQVRDLLLLVVRTLCVLLFGLAMARPYFAHSAGAVGPGQPVHAVLVIDNSLSMGYQRLDGAVLDEAKKKAREFIQLLPPGSQITVLPACGAAADFSWDPYRTKDDALKALEGIDVVDRQAGAAQSLDLAVQACQRATDLATKRVVLLGDQQASNWPAESLASQLKQLSDVQIVPVSPERPENAWVADFRIRDGIADVETQTMFLATVRYEGQQPRRDVQVTLAIDGVPTESQTIDLEPGQSREVSFPYRFDISVEPGKANYATAAVSIPADRLPADDSRSLVVPVVAALPVVFVDPLGDEEDPAANRFGETLRFRRLLAPVTTRGDYGRQLIQVRHVRIDELDRALLEDARLVVVAGVESPGASAALLREYVEQGGQLVIAAGGAFDPAAWNNEAWLAGAGVLPAPLAPDFVGSRPDEAAGELKPFFLDPPSLVHDYFQLEGVGRDELTDLYRLPLFFKAVEVDLREETLAALTNAEAARIEARRTAAVTPPEPGSASALRLRFSESTTPADDSKTPPTELAQRTRPRALAMFSNRLPYLVQRQIGQGQVLFVASGVQPEWNTLATTDTVLIFDRIFRSMLQETLPERNVGTIEQVLLPVEPQDRQNRITLQRPGRAEELLTVDALGGDRYGVTVRNLSRRGVYRITAHRAEAPAGAVPASPMPGNVAAAGGAVADTKVWEIPLAAGGPERESELRSLDRAGLEARLSGGQYRWIARDEPIRLEGAGITGQNLWKVLMAGVLACLCVELGVLAWPSFARRAGP